MPAASVAMTIRDDLVTIASMREVKHSALVAQPPGRLFDLINDIESYPRFIPWCTHARVLSRSPTEIVATIGLHRGPLTGEFTTRNELEPERRILMHLVSGPFRMLEGEWLISPIAPGAAAGPTGHSAAVVADSSSANESVGAGCRVQLTMKFAFRNPVTAWLFEQKFAETAASLVDAFVGRARALSQK